MCKWNKWGDTRIDPCMRNLIDNLNCMFKDNWEIKACCCGHERYPMSIIVQDKKWKAPFDLVSGKNVHSKKKFYKKDAQGYYYIPETMEVKNG